MKKGFSSINFLIGFMISFLVLNLLSTSLRIAKNINLDNYNNDVIAALQLYQILNISTFISVEDQQINFKYLSDDRSLSLVNNKLILQPGTVIYFTNVDDLKFTNLNDKIILNVSRKNKQSRFLIGEFYE